MGNRLFGLGLERSGPSPASSARSARWRVTSPRSTSTSAASSALLSPTDLVLAQELQLELELQLEMELLLELAALFLSFYI
jgi:hypothetical protein